MKITNTTLLAALLTAPAANAFTFTTPRRNVVLVTSTSSSSSSSSTSSSSSLGMGFSDTIEESLNRQLKYSAGTADTEFAKRFGDLKGKQVRTVAESFSDFSSKLGFTINALYKNMVTDIVGQVHLITVSARFTRDPVWSLGLITAMETLLKNYPEKHISEKIITCLIECVGMTEDEVRGEAAALLKDIEGKTADDIFNQLSTAEGDGVIAGIAKNAKADEYWQYSKFFGLGLVKVMETVGVEQTMEESYATMEKWMKDGLGKKYFTATQDSDQWFKMKQKLDMMETLMKEIEIREKKRMADRLEEQAEMALKRAQREKEMDEAAAKEKELQAQEKSS